MFAPRLIPNDIAQCYNPDRLGGVVHHGHLNGKECGQEGKAALRARKSSTEHGGGRAASDQKIPCRETGKCCFLFLGSYNSERPNKSLKSTRRIHTLIIMKSQKVKMARLVRRDEMDRSFDIEFWANVGVQGRFEAAWQMVKEVHAIRGEKVGESRLQRSVQNIKRRNS